MDKKRFLRLDGWRGILLIALALGTTLLIWNSRRPKPLDLEASALLDAMLEGDGSQLVGYAFKEEIAGNQLDSRKLRRLYQKLIIPRIDRLSRTSERVLQDNGDQGVAEYEVRTKFGLTLPLAAAVYTTEDGPKASVLRALYGAWMFEYFNAHDETFTELARKRAVLAGLRSDKHVLKHIGISKLTDLNVVEGTVTMIDIDDMEARYAAWVIQLEQAPSTN